MWVDEGFAHNGRNSQATSSNAVTMTTEALASFIFSRISHTLSCQERPANIVLATFFFIGSENCPTST